MFPCDGTKIGLLDFQDRVTKAVAGRIDHDLEKLPMLSFLKSCSPQPSGAQSDFDRFPTQS